jgi:hypothetical protein
MTDRMQKRPRSRLADITNTPNGSKPHSAFDLETYKPPPRKLTSFYGRKPHKKATKRPITTFSDLSSEIVVSPANAIKPLAPIPEEPELSPVEEEKGDFLTQTKQRIKKNRRSSKKWNKKAAPIPPSNLESKETEEANKGDVSVSFIFKNTNVPDTLSFLRALNEVIDEASVMELDDTFSLPDINEGGGFGGAHDDVFGHHGANNAETSRSTVDVSTNRGDIDGEKTPMREPLFEEELSDTLEEIKAIKLSPTPKARIGALESDDPLQSASPVTLRKRFLKKSKLCSSPLSFNNETDPLLD